MILENSTSDLLKVMGENWMLVLVGALIALILGCLIGYLVGNTSLRSKVTADIDGLERDMQIHKAVLDSVGIGMAVYGNNGAIFALTYEDTWPWFSCTDTLQVATLRLMDLLYMTMLAVTYEVHCKYLVI